MLSTLAAIVARLERRRIIVLCIFGAALLFCGYLSLHLVTREDILVLVPEDDSRLAAQFSLFRDAPFLSTVRITVGGGDAPPQAHARALADALRERGVPFVATGPGTAALVDPAHVLPFLPSLLPPDTIRVWGERQDAAVISDALRKDTQVLVSPAGPAVRGLVAADPLRLHEVFFRSLAPLREAGSIPVRNGYFTDAGGRYCLVIAKPDAAMTDSAASAAFLDTVRDAIASLPPGAESIITGSYRHSEANAAVIKGDLNRVLPASLFLLSALFLVFIRKKQAVAILAMPVAALCFASVATAFFYGAISGIVLGFGSVILGITADYAIHTYYAVTHMENVKRAFTELLPSLLAGACTTACAFGTLFFSGIPAIRQVALFGLSGIAAALAVAVFILPLLLRSQRCSGIPSSPARLTPRPVVAVSLVAFLGLVVCISFAGVAFDGDIRNISYMAADIMRDERRSKEIWNMPDDGAFLAAVGDGSDAGFEKALQINDGVWDILRREKIPASGIGLLFPSRARQDASAVAWKNLWEQKGNTILATLDALAQEAGFSPDAFRPFKAWVFGEPENVTGETLSRFGFGFLPAMFTNSNQDRSTIYTVLPAGTELGEAARSSLAETGAEYVSGATFRESMAETISGDILRFCLLTLAAICIAVFFVFRAPFRCLAILAPTLAGVAFTLAFFRLTGTAITMFHAIALPLVIALSVDYGIFMQAVLEGRMGKHGRNGVLLSALTTLAGFGSLLLARHPALFSLGMAVSGGIAAALAAALWLQPLFFAKETPAAEDRAGCA